MSFVRVLLGVLIGFFTTRAILYPDSEYFWLYVAIPLLSIAITVYLFKREEKPSF